MARKTKYRLLAKEEIIPDVVGWTPGAKRTVYRLKAIRDIPEHGVKKGDLGGLVSHYNNLSQEGSCWIDYHATVVGKVYIKEDVYITGTALVLCDWRGSAINLTGSVEVYGNARIYVSGTSVDSRISGNAKFFDDSVTGNLLVGKDNIEIFGSARIKHAAEVSGTSKIHGKAIVEKNAVVKGDSNLSGDSVVQEEAQVTSLILHGKAQIGRGEEVEGGTFEDECVFVTPKKVLPEVFIGDHKTMGALKHSKNTAQKNPASAPIKSTEKTKAEKNLALLAEVQQDIASYETDIVKIIKYPTMTDRTDPYTLNLAKALKKALRVADAPESTEFELAVSELEDAFMEAESNALKLSATKLSEEEKKKTERAKDLLAIAENEGSSEQEKKVSFKQAFKQLEGVLVVPDVAVDAFRVRVGLKEIDA